MKRFFRGFSPVDQLAAETVEEIWGGALQLLAECGAEMHDDAARATLAAAGAQVSGTRVRFDLDLVADMLAQAPQSAPLCARNPENDAGIGGTEVLASPLYGATHVLDPDGTRRPGTLADLQAFHDLAQAAPELQNTGANIVEPTDIAPALRHLHTMRSVLTRSDKAFMPVTSSRDPQVAALGLAGVRARDSLEMARIALGESFGRGPAMIGVATCLEALSWAGPALEAIRLFAEAGQAVILAPFAVAGQNAAPDPAALLTQITAEILAAAVYAQAVRPGTPILFGPHFMLALSGEKVSAGADTELMILASGQIARRAGLPFRAVGGLTGAKILDAQAGAEAEGSLAASLLAGAHFLFHGAGWLDCGLAVSRAKFAFDCAALAEAQRRHAGLRLGQAGEAAALLHGWGPEIDHATRPATAGDMSEFYEVSPVADHLGWDEWQAKGALDAATRSANQADRMVAEFQPLPQDRTEALDDFIARRSRDLTG
jgi:trimethylamine--corrinoid protein Co-methyltransferase